MPLESLSCSHCGSGDVQQVKPDTYFCNHCDSLFKYVNSGQMAGGVGCELALPTGKTCGVPPIGRCVTCYRTFCATHYGENLISPTNARGCCLECAIKAENARLEHEIRFGQSYLVNSARDALKSAGVAPVQIYSRRTENQVRSFGRSRFVDYLDPWATGWIIGTFPWKYRDGPYGGTEVERECLTALIDDTARSSIFNYYFSTDRNLARISKGPDRDVFVVAQSGGFIRSPYDEISRTIHRMTE